MRLTAAWPLATMSSLVLVVSGCTGSESAPQPTMHEGTDEGAGDHSVWRETEQRYIPDSAPQLSVESTQLDPFFQHWPGEPEEPPQTMDWKQVSEGEGPLAVTVEEDSVPLRVVAMFFPRVDAEGVPYEEEAEEQVCHELDTISDLDEQVGGCAFAPTGEQSTQIVWDEDPDEKPQALYRVVQISWIQAEEHATDEQPLVEAQASYGWMAADETTRGETDGP